MRHAIAFAVVLVLAIGADDAPACSQCMCGTPFPAGVFGGVVPMQFTYGLEDRYLSKTNALDEGPGSEDEREHRLAAFGLWRPHARFALLGRLPYAFKEITSMPEGEATTLERAHGLGDAEMLAMIGIARSSGVRATALGAVVGFTAPTGPSDLKNASGERLEAHLQPGTGAWTGTGGLNLSVPGHPGSWEASIVGRVNGTNAHGYRYGNVVLYNAGFTSSPRDGVRLLLELNGRSAGKDQLEDGTMGANTGGTVVYVAPGLRWVSSVGLGLEAAVQVPAVQALYGDQTEHTTARVNLFMTH
jgi:hypothetical protein